MGDSESFFKRHLQGYKEFWGERFSFLENYSRFINRDKPLLSWSASDVEEFVASDPVNGPTLRTAREAVNFGELEVLLEQYQPLVLRGNIQGVYMVLGYPFLLEVYLVGHLDRKLQIIGCNSTGWTPCLHKLSSWNGGRRNVKDTKLGYSSQFVL